ncbi:MAG: phosphatidylglycerophosphatase [Acidobacteria bacterium]|nr:phosphatidylglycerophosphatase [Acidobacteriota bacterium]
MKDRISLLFASGFCIGMIPGAPGTYASLAAALVYYRIYRISLRILPELHLSAICLITLAGVYAAARVSRNLGREDPGVVVIDEIAGQLVAFLFLPVNAVNLIAGVCLFRLFDIWKPFPIRRLESLPNGVGIMSDDLLAGVYANLILQLANHLMQK